MPAVFVLLLLSYCFSAVVPAAFASDQIDTAPIVQGFEFEQEKQLQGLPRPIRSTGRLTVYKDHMYWIVEHPVATTIRVDGDGIQEVVEGEGKLVSGSKFVARLLMAVIQNDREFLKDHFEASSCTIEAENCTRFIPLSQQILDYYQDISVYGQPILNGIVLNESNGSITTIKLSPQKSSEE